MELIDETCNILFEIAKETLTNLDFDDLSHYPMTRFLYFDDLGSEITIQFSFRCYAFQLVLNPFYWDTYDDDFEGSISIHNINCIDENIYNIIYKFNKGKLYENEIQIEYNEKYFIKLYNYVKTIMWSHVVKIHTKDENIFLTTLDQNNKFNDFQKEFEECYIIFDNLELVLLNKLLDF
uniref:Uncharacterized protein n=1 Tax=Pithovirus LCDPAC02 TaxID=2506601 RepID=A0A481YPF1_9VIRU|nr:MAG: hypothetical protein LCDPAC02_01880 [Pithovirus LCDPAC02]